MPNWVTTKLKTSPEVIQSMLNADGNIDFNTIAPFPGPNNSWGGIVGDAEMAAEVICKIPLNDNRLIASLEASNRAGFDIKKLSDESFKQLVGMLENYRACNYLHCMEFNRATWGTKWNACESETDSQAGTASFETAWSCPTPLLTELSKRFSDEAIEVVFADEDIGSNCGSFTLKGGVITTQDVAPPWSEMDEAQRERWSAFAYEVKGWKPDEDDD